MKTKAAFNIDYFRVRIIPYILNSVATELFVTISCDIKTAQNFKFTKLLMH